MVILIDSGSTHDFLDVALWKVLQLPISTQDCFEVKVANGTVLKIEKVCLDVQLKIQGTSFGVDLNVLPLGGRDVVLSTQWLYSLGPIQWDFKALTMQFVYFGKLVLLQDLTPSVSTFQDGNRFFKPIVKKGFVLQIVSCSSPLLAVQQCSAIADLLREFAKVFEVPIGLPPLKGHEHQIILKEGTSPIYERP